MRGIWIGQLLVVLVGLGVLVACGDEERVGDSKTGGKVKDKENRPKDLTNRIGKGEKAVSLVKVGQLERLVGKKVRVVGRYILYEDGPQIVRGDFSVWVERGDVNVYEWTGKRVGAEGVLEKVVVGKGTREDVRMGREDGVYYHLAPGAMASEAEDEEE